MMPCVERFRRRTCSTACQYLAWVRRQREKRPAKTFCAVCNVSFQPTRADACYCSSACRQSAYRKRHERAA